MLVPARRNMFNDFMMSPFDAFFDTPQTTKPANGFMKTDIKQNDKEFQLVVDLPGIEKENVTCQLNDGYLEVTATSSHEDEDKDDNGSFIRKERFEGKCSRSFYVGDEINEDGITAKFENGTLKITVPKATKPDPEEKRTIAIS